MATLPETTAYPLGLDWNDSQSPAYSLPNGGTSPTLTAITTNISGLSYGLNDLGHFAIQMPHSVAPGSDLRVHVHFTFPTQPTAGYKLRWEVFFSVGAINAAFGAESAAQYGEYTVQASDALIHRVQSICTVTAPTPPQSCILIGRIRRVASTGTECDVEPILLALDAHFQQGPVGTQTEFA